MMYRHRLLSLIPVAMLLAAPPPASAQKGDLADDWTRQEMAMGLLRALGGPDNTPPDCVPDQEMFEDVPASNPFCPWIEELARRGITGGCGGDNYCPTAPVSRAQMATFLVRTQFPAQVPPGVTVIGRWGFNVHVPEGVDVSDSDWGTNISFPAPMPAAPEVRYLLFGDDPTDECPGTMAQPAAAPGFLCIYELQSYNAIRDQAFPTTEFGTTQLFVPEQGGDDMDANGSWAATAHLPVPASE